jgi:hypothetical protein
MTPKSSLAHTQCNSPNELLIIACFEAPVDERPAMLENIAKALTRRLLKDEPGIGAREVSKRVTAFEKAVRSRL